jgi:hypothetical protein
MPRKRTNWKAYDAELRQILTTHNNGSITDKQALLLISNVVRSHTPEGAEHV